MRNQWNGIHTAEIASDVPIRLGPRPSRSLICGHRVANRGHRGIRVSSTTSCTTPSLRRVTFCVALVLLIAPASYALDLTVTIASGRLRGAHGEVASFKGIPYAAAPVGRLRWRAPEGPAFWRDVRDATQFGPQCPQPQPSGVANEDCLTLNVWTSARSTSERLPVVVWIHGGGFFRGSGSNSAYDGDALARRGVVLVTLNYRLGALGFLAHPSLSRESAHGVSGNYGLLDQMSALRWVQKNIAHFGGDPANITVAGESGGAYSICILMVSPLAKGLFHRAILQSLPLMFQPTRRLREAYAGLPSAEAEGAARVADIRAARRMSAEEIVNQVAPASTLSTGVHFYPVVDGWLLPEDPSVLILARRRTLVPVLMGYGADEGNFFLANAPKTVSGFRAFVAHKFPRTPFESILAMYPAATDADAPVALAQFFGDYELLTSTVLTARAASKRGNVYLYQFSRVGPRSRRLWNGAAHTADIPYVFDHVQIPSEDFDPPDKMVSDAMVGAWVRFAKSGNPNGPNLPEWPRYDEPDYRYLNYSDRISTESGFRESEIEFCRLVLEQAAKRDPNR
jgi:para-nitrobenzyl esterase